MLTNFLPQANKNKASASVVDGKLILSFPQAQTPVLWQMDLTQAKSSALEVQKEGKSDICFLALKTQKGEEVKIASFDTREEALNGLLAASDALKNAHGNIQTAANEDQKISIAHAPAPRKRAGKGQWVTGIVAVFALVAIFGVWSSTTPKTPRNIQTTNTNSLAQQTAPTNAAQTAGVPVSADDFLSGL
ncbi:MAG: hypothetical protein AB8B83_03235 [Bdellovibrionales bacterium]